MVACVIRLRMMFPAQEIRLLKWVSAGEKTPNFLKYAKKCTWDLGSANKTCLREMWAQWGMGGNALAPSVTELVQEGRGCQGELLAQTRYRCWQQWQRSSWLVLHGRGHSIFGVFLTLPVLQCDFRHRSWEQPWSTFSSPPQKSVSFNKFLFCLTQLEWGAAVYH